MFRTIKKSSVFILFLILLFFIASGVRSEAAEKKQVVVIDAAHGGEDSGVKSADKIMEKDITLAIALALQKELEKDTKLEVILTRNDDKTVSIEERRKNIEKIKPALVLSIHANAGFSKSAGGFELYYPGFKKQDQKKKADKSGADNIKNKYLNDSVRLAQLVQKNMDALFPRKGRGLREAEVPLTTGLAVSGLVLEIGFATNPEEKKKLTTEKIQADVARALARSIKSFF